MLDVGIIGIGNTGNQIAALAVERLNIPVVAINSSEKDLETISSNIPKMIIGDKEGLSQGAGKDRALAKKYLKDSVMGIIQSDIVKDMLAKLDICFIISSTGGGTGSGTAPLMAEIVQKTCPNLKVILVGVLPVDSEALSGHVNTLEYLNELYKVLKDQTYMLYDNDKLAELPSYQIMTKVNEEVVADIDVIRCTYNFTTKYDSIDDRDMTRLISYPGRIVVSRLEDFKEKDCDNITIEEMIIDNIKRNCHVEAQRDKSIMASGIITNLSQVLTEEFNNNIPKVREFVGTPIHSFNHISVNEDRKAANNVFFIMSGLKPVNDRINKISDRIDEIEEMQKTMIDENALNDVGLDELSSKIADKTDTDTAEKVDIGDIFSNFGL